MPGENRVQLHLRVHDEVHHEKVRQHRGGLAHVLVQGISGQNAVSDFGVRAQRLGVKRIGVVVADGLKTADPGEDALSAAAEARHDMMRARAEADDKIGRRDGFIEPDRRIVRGRAEVDKVLCLAIVVLDTHLVKNVACYQRSEFLLIAAPMRAVGHDDGELAVIYAARGMQVLDQMRNHKVLPHPEPGHIAHHECNARSCRNLLA